VQNTALPLNDQIVSHPSGEDAHLIQSVDEKRDIFGIAGIPELARARGKRRANQRPVGDALGSGNAEHSFDRPRRYDGPAAHVS
jgi:hypothetical protein